MILQKNKFTRTITLFITLMAIPMAGYISIKFHREYYEWAYRIAVVVGAFHIYFSIPKMPIKDPLRISVIVLILSALSDYALEKFSIPGWKVVDIALAIYLCWEYSREVKKYSTK